MAFLITACLLCLSTFLDIFLKSEEQDVGNCMIHAFVFLGAFILISIDIILRSLDDVFPQFPSCE